MTAALREVGTASDHPITTESSSASHPAIRRRRLYRFAVADKLGAIGGVAIPFAAGLRPLTGTASGTAQVLTAAGMAGVWLLALAVLNDRRVPALGRHRARVGDVLLAALLVVAAASMAAFLISAPLSTTFVGVSTATGAAAVALSRVAVTTAAGRAAPATRVLVVGSRSTATSLIARLGRTPGVQVVGACLEPDTLLPDRLHETPVLGTSADVAELAARYDVDVVAVTGASHHSAEELRDLVWSLEDSGAQVVFPVDVPDVGTSRLRLTGGTVATVRVRHATFRGPRYVVKDILDRAAAGLLVLALSPVLLGTAAAVKLTSPGPVFYRQERIGRDGVPFRIWKFRSMRQDADRQLEAVMGDNIRPFYKREDDPRITPVGRFIRRYSIDELPQLFNVLSGDMALVGPRPQIDKEVATYDHVAWRRLRVKPGLTGLWQVSGRSSLPPEEGIRLDVAYADNWTLPGDASILARTAKAVVSSDGAY